MFFSFFLSHDDSSHEQNISQKAAPLIPFLFFYTYTIATAATAFVGAAWLGLNFNFIFNLSLINFN